MLDLNKECGNRHTLTLISQGERHFKIRATWEEETPYVMLTTVYDVQGNGDMIWITELIEEKDGEPDRIVHTEYDGHTSPGIWDDPEDALSLVAYSTDEEFEILLQGAKNAGKL